jgi:hypothetical protein
MAGWLRGPSTAPKSSCSAPDTIRSRQRKPSRVSECRQVSTAAFPQDRRTNYSAHERSSTGSQTAPATQRDDPSGSTSTPPPCTAGFRRVQPSVALGARSRTCHGVCEHSRIIPSCGQGGSVVDAWLEAVAVLAWQVNQHREACGAFDQRADGGPFEADHTNHRISRWSHPSRTCRSLLAAPIESGTFGGAFGLR